MQMPQPRVVQKATGRRPRRSAALEPTTAPGALATNMSPDASVNAAGAQPVAASTRASASAGATTNAVGAVYTPAQALRRAQGTLSAWTALLAASLPAASPSDCMLPIQRSNLEAGMHCGPVRCRFASMRSAAANCRQRA